MVIDVGTNTDRLLDDPVYGGIRKHRVEGAAYDAFLDEFVMAVKDRSAIARVCFFWGGGGCGRLVCVIW